MSPVYVDPCQPSPCGPNADCRIVNSTAVCTCRPEYIGTPPSCRPECVMSSQCPKDKACLKQRCQDPCPGVCGLNAQCQVYNHSPFCSCLPGYTGAAFSSCYPEPRIQATASTSPAKDPCTPSPCGPYAQCTAIGNLASCNCMDNYMGSPPNCRPECTISSECASNLSCLNGKCQDPCAGTCGFSALCHVINHTPSCSCPADFTGDPFVSCRQIPAIIRNVAINTTSRFHLNSLSMGFLREIYTLWIFYIECIQF